MPPIQGPGPCGLWAGRRLVPSKCEEGGAAGPGESGVLGSF